jgi:hypothetical protein
MIPFFLGGALLFYQLSQTSVKTLLVIGLMILYAAGVFYYKYMESSKFAETTAERQQKMHDAILPNQIAHSDQYGVKRFPRDGKFHYLPHNSDLMDIAHDIRFVRSFDKARYADLLLHLDKFQKTYMYLLADRLVCSDGIPTLLDYRVIILELLQSMILIVPKSLKHSYGLSPFDVLEKNVQRFTAVSRVMLQVIEAHCKTQIPYTQAYDPMRMST